MALGSPSRVRPRRAARLLRGAALLIGLVVAGALVVPSLPDLNPFGTETKDRSQPVLLRSLERLDEYRAATANLQVVVDVEEDTNLLPSFIKGEKTLFVAAGNVDAGVDFSALDGRSLDVSDDRRSVTVTLPRAVVSEPRLDLRRSRVFDRERGLVDRVAGVFSDDPDDERRIFALAERKLLEAARSDGSLVAAAERNTRSMLDRMLRGLGYERITVRFGATSAR